MPWCDEAWFATPGINLATNGTFGTPVLDETAAWNDAQPARRKPASRTGSCRCIRWWWRMDFVAGTSLFAVRTFSMMWGLVALVAWFLMVRKLAEPDGTRPALFMAALLAVDFQFVWYAGVGAHGHDDRGAAARSFASYLWLRETNFTRAVLVSQTFMMLAGMTHPISLGGFVGLLFLTLYFDWRKVRIQHVALAVLPYAGWRRGVGTVYQPGSADVLGPVPRQRTGPVLARGRLDPVDLGSVSRSRFLWMYGFASG